MDNTVDSNFLQCMPKVELHAHLNGSLNITSICELGLALHGTNSAEFTRLSQQFVSVDKELDDWFLKFRFIHELTATPAGLSLATELVIRDFAKDNTIYLELRTTPKSNEYMNKRTYLECVLSTIRRCKQLFDVHVVLLPSIDRSQSVEAAKDTVHLVLELLEGNKDVIAGIDFSGNPKYGNFNDFAPVLAEARQKGLKLALHCAEINNETEVAQMVEFGMDRCGHGTFLNEAQIKMLAQQNTAIECCLTSNVKSGTVPNYDDHHFQQIFNNDKGMVVICTDDCGVFDTTLSREFEILCKTFHMQKSNVLHLTINAIKHAFVDEDIKEKMQQKIYGYFSQIK